MQGLLEISLVCIPLGSFTVDLTVLTACPPGSILAGTSFLLLGFAAFGTEACPSTITVSNPCGKLLTTPATVGLVTHISSTACECRPTALAVWAGAGMHRG